MPDNKETLLKPGTVIDQKWIIIEMIGKGAMGEVYRAHQVNLKRDVAIKIVSDEMIRELEDDTDEIETLFRRFQREVHAMAQVRHPNILNIFDFGLLEGHMAPRENPDKSLEYIVMEYIPGNTLRFTMSDQGLEDEPSLYADWIRQYFLQILDGVEAMHNYQVFHRDLKPENIFMDREIPKIADFGLARSYKMKAVSNSMDMKGTLIYMAPEQFSEFRKADQTADIYALGKMLYEALAGKLDQKTLPLKEVGLEIPEDDASPFLKEMDDIIRTVTREDKHRRFQSVGELRGRLLKALDLEKTRGNGSALQESKPAEFVNRYSSWIWAGIVAAVLSVALMTAWHLFGEPGSGVKEGARTERMVAAGPGIDLPENLENLKPEVIGTDGSHLVLAGTPGPESSGNSEEPLENMLLYIDKKKISNYLYVEFLNEIRNEVTVENSVVKHNGIVILYLDTGNPQEERIIYRHERFHLKDQKYGPLPVARVTFHGAFRYARFYGRSLPTGDEWKFAYRFFREQTPEEPLQVKPDAIESEGHMNLMHGVPGPDPEGERVEVLDGMGLEMKEWVKISGGRAAGAQQPEKDNKSGYSGVMDVETYKSGSKPALRQQWEGFADVGFRTEVRIR
ncbi:MAG: protein kinase [Desulfarculaceae bacterium]|nr:protein kinase [Desulfarculaceae bacterium]